MFRNIFYDTKSSEIHLWEEINGSKEYTSIYWTPYFFQKCNEESDIKTIDGFNVKKRIFNTFSEYTNSQKEASNIYENNVIPTLQFLSERYYGIPDEEMPTPNLKIYSIDLEIFSENGFPHATIADCPITAINIKSFGGDSYTWGLKPYNGKTKFNYVNKPGEISLNYSHCKNEPDLIKSFILWFHRHPPDILTGWNIASDNKTNRYGGFDLHYLVNRCHVIFGDDTTIYNKLSPISKFKKWTQKETNTMIFDIAGITIMDYMSLYKWYTPKNQENYMLQTICKDELGVGKLDYSSYGDLKNLYKENWDMYVEYNVYDNIRIEELESKLGYIKLAQSLSLLCKTPMKSYNASVQQIEGLLLTHFRRNNLCAPYFAGGTQEYFPAAYVKDPIKGLSNWVIDIDIASSYPTSIIIMNMSPETYIGRITSLTESEIVNSCKTKNFNKPFSMVKTNGISKFDEAKLSSFNEMFKRKIITIAPCGTVFDNTKKGIYASIEKHVFFKRKEIKKKMIQLKKESLQFEKTDPLKFKSMQEQAARYFSLQWALKIVLNQAFGVLAVPYCRYHNTNIAEAITSCSKNTIIEGQNFVNKLLNNPELSDEFNNTLSSFIESVNA